MLDTLKVIDVDMLPKKYVNHGSYASSRANFVPLIHYKLFKVTCGSLQLDLS